MKVAFPLICYNWGRSGNETINYWVYTGRPGNKAVWMYLLMV